LVELLKSQDFVGAADFMEKFNVVNDFDIGASRTVMIVTKCFKDIPKDGVIDRIKDIREELYQKHCKALGVDKLY
jgi:hypothetical protein